MKNNPLQEKNHDEIAKEAYKIWEERGKPCGEDVACWLQAEARMCERPKPVSGS
jgi:hypothetical protein